MTDIESRDPLSCYLRRVIGISNKVKEFLYSRVSRYKYKKGLRVIKTLSYYKQV